MSPLYLKIGIFLIICLAAYLWAHGKLDKQIKKAVQYRKRYGLGTVILVVAWWLLTPTGAVDDVVTLWAYAWLGATWYTTIVILLTAYLLYRLKVTIVVYQ